MNNITKLAKYIWARGNTLWYTPMCGKIYYWWNLSWNRENVCEVELNVG